MLLTDPLVKVSPFDPLSIRTLPELPSSLRRSFFVIPLMVPRVAWFTCRGQSVAPICIRAALAFDCTGPLLGYTWYTLLYSGFCY